MMQIRLYLDEDAQRGQLARALRERGVDVQTADEAGLRKQSDDLQLAHAAAAGRALFSYNIRDYNRLHTEFMQQGAAHAGLILTPQQRFGIGEQLRRLLRIASSLSAEQMQNRLEFLSDWQ